MSQLKDEIEIGIEEAEIKAGKALNTLPTAVKWFLIVGIIAILPVYFISKAISKNIWNKKYSRIQTVGHPSFANPKDPITSDITVTSPRDGAYAAVLKITNPNLDLSLDQTPYEIDFSNTQKQQIYNYKDTLFLLPNETKYLTVPTFTAQDQIAYTNIQFTKPLPWQKRISIPTINISQSLPAYSQQTNPPAFVVSGDFTNQSPYILKQVRIIFVLYDSNNNIVGVSQRDEFSVGSFERRAYTQLWPNQNGSNVARADIEVYTDTLNSNNLTAPVAPTGSASDLSRPSGNDKN